MLRSIYHKLRLLGKRRMNIEDFVTIKEGSASVLVPKEEKVFYNPIQQFNRDLSVMGIKAWNKIYNEDHNREVKTKKRKVDSNGNKEIEPSSVDVKDRKTNLKIMEALSATGLRALRYAKEIPEVTKVVANDLLPEAVESIRRNAEYNQVLDKVHPNQGDAIKVMASTNEKFHVIDLDPYGTAAPFIDSAIQAMKDDGLLLITCTDAGVLAGAGYPEKCFSLYGGHNFGNSHVSGEANHEAGLRLILGMLANTAAKYKKTIHPLLSLSIDFYFRVFVKISTRPIEVKELSTKTMLSFYCTNCGDKHHQYLGRCVEKDTKKKYQVPKLVTIGSKCEHCEGTYHLAGPMWGGSLHDSGFIDELLDVNANSDDNVYATRERIKGMLNLAKHELSTPFYFNLNQLTSLLKAPPIPIENFCNAVGNMGYNVSLTHAKKNCLKTDAPTQEILLIVKAWLVKSNESLLESFRKRLSDDPDNEKIKEKVKFYEEHIDRNPKLTPGMVGYRILEKLKDKTINPEFDKENEFSKSVHVIRSAKLVRYQENPTKNWGPKARPGN